MKAECYYIWDIIITALSVFATLFLGIVAIWQNKKYKDLADNKDKVRASEIKEENRLKIKPYLFCTYTEENYDYLLSKMEKVEFIYIDDFSTEKIAYEYHYSVPKEIEKEFDNGSSIVKRSLYALDNLYRYLLVSYTIKNIGRGSATDINLKINQKITEAPFSLIPSESRKINILFDFNNIHDLKEEKIELRFEYKDVENNNYIQSTEFTIHDKETVEGSKKYYTSSFCKVTEPTQLKESK